jgi:DNA (cytosine-5)-methyltransferase 1
VDKLVDWSDEGDDRFFISEAYNSDLMKFSPLESEVVDVLRSVLSSHPAASLDPVPPLACLDIFAGCGGLSRGLHESGVTQLRWAIEFWQPSAEALKKNNPDCEVMIEECNWLLSKAMQGDKDTRIPEKGEVEMMVGGPPCQGFSLLNIHKEGEYSKFKNSLIATYLSYCDFYRPRFFILENVRNLVMHENGMVLKLIIAALVKMGYQVTFSILQAGHYGVAQ